LNSIAVTPTSTTTLPKGTSATLTATGTYSDGTSANISTQVDWTSDHPLIASVGLHTGNVHGEAAVGTATVTAALGSITSSNAINFNATAGTLISVAIAPASTTTLAIGTTAYLTATGTYSDGPHDITTVVDWISNHPLIASVGLHDGSVLGAAGGTATVTAALGSITSSNAATITVTSATLSSFTITASASLPKGTDAQLIATGIYSDGSSFPVTSQVTWSSNNTSIATVGSHDGIVHGAAVGGPITITAAYSGLTSQTASITVSDYATWNPADMGSDVYLVDANLTAKSTNTTWYRSIRATVGISSGKVYWEITPIYGAAVFGIMGPSANLESWVGDDAYGWGMYPVDGALFGIGKNPGWVAPAFTSGSVIGFGLDMDAKTLRIWVNGVDKGIAFTGLTGTIYPASTIFAGGATANFGATPFVTDPLPAGYDAGVFQH
jgi:uncharacterized protein YjdB